MLLENPCPVGTETPDGAHVAPFPKIKRNMSDEEYYAWKKAETQAENARVVAEAEPIVAAVEKRLQQENILVRVLVETGVKEEVLRGLLERRVPRDLAREVYRPSARNDALAALAAWLSEDKKRRNAAPGHADTPTLKAIYRILAEGMEFGLMSVIIGAFGIGKSRAGELVVDEFPRSRHQPGAVLVELRTEDTTVARCIESLCRRLRHDTHGRGSYADLCRLLRPGDLLILDEAQRLGNCDKGAMVEVVRDLHKDTGAGIALIGNPIMKRGRDGIIGNDLYGAFLSRAEVHDFTKGNSREDVEAWMLWKGLSGRRLADKLVALATKLSNGQFGGLRELEKVYSQAARRHPGEAVTTDLVLEALELRGARA